MILPLMVLGSVNAMHLSACGRVDTNQERVVLPGWCVFRQLGVGHLYLPLVAACLTVAYIALTLCQTVLPELEIQYFP